MSMNTMYVKNGHKAMVHVMRKEYIKTSLHLSKALKNAPPLSSVSYASSPSYT